MTRSLLPRLVTFGLVLVLASLCTYWILIFTSRGEPPEPVAATVASDSARTQAVDIAPLARLFGGALADAPGDVTLIGVIAEGTGGKGVAILSIDRQPALAVRAGDTLPDGTVLTEVRPESILVNRGGVAQEIALPARPALQGLKPAR
jgi:general secretion pathway protein C